MSRDRSASTIMVVIRRIAGLNVVGIIIRKVCITSVSNVCQTDVTTLTL